MSNEQDKKLVWLGMGQAAIAIAAVAMLVVATVLLAMLAGSQYAMVYGAVTAVGLLGVMVSAGCWLVLHNNRQRDDLAVDRVMAKARRKV